MAKFLYQAKASTGQVMTGQLEAADEAEARVKLRSKNMVPLRLVQAQGAGGQMIPGLAGLFQKRVKSQDLQIFTRQFSTLVNSGIPIVDSLKMLSEGKRDETLKEVATRIRESIESGKRLGESMAQHPSVFDRFFINMIRAGEEAGILDGILARLTTYLEKSEKLRKQVKGAMMYPLMIVCVAILVVSGILIFIIPRFQDLYASSGKELPAVTQIVVKLSHGLINQWYVVLAILVGGPVFLIQWYRTPEGRTTMDQILISAPLFGDLVQKSAVARRTRTLSTLLSSGVNVIDALEIASRTSGNIVIENALLRCKDSVTSGQSLASTLSREKMIPDMVTQMIAIGEKSGTLDSMLGKIADFYEDDVESAVKGLTSMIEPLLMVVLGGIIAFLVVAMYLPVFDMANTVGH